MRVLYGKAIALNGLTMRLDEPKEMVGVVGPNGAGKTHPFAGHFRFGPGRGEIFFQGERIDHQPPHEIVAPGNYPLSRRRQLFVDFTVAENLEMGAFLRKDESKIRDDQNLCL